MLDEKDTIEVGKADTHRRQRLPDQMYRQAVSGQGSGIRRSLSACLHGIFESDHGLRRKLRRSFFHLCRTDDRGRDQTLYAGRRLGEGVARNEADREGDEYVCRGIYLRARSAARRQGDCGKVRPRRKRNGVRHGLVQNARIHLRRFGI